MKTAYLHCDLDYVIQGAGNSLDTAPLLVRMLRHVSRAVDYMHHKGVVHHDIKPTNIMLKHTRTDGSPMERFLAATFVVIDFGLAKQYPPEVQLEASGYSAGTPRYSSPEKRSNTTYNAFAADWYALGITALEMTIPDLWTTLSEEEYPQTPREVAFYQSFRYPHQEVYDIIYNFLVGDQVPIDQALLAKLENLR